MKKVMLPGPSKLKHISSTSKKISNRNLRRTAKQKILDEAREATEIK